MTFDDLCRHFGIQTHPFARAVPPTGLLHHPSFDESLTRLSLAVESFTPALFTAEPGLGKSTLLGTLADALDPARHRLVYTPLCSCGPFGLIGQLAQRYGVRVRRSAAQTAQVMLDELQRSDRHEILVLDDAHRLPDSSLDELRLLSNLDFDRRPPFALLVVGQPLLRERINHPDLTSLRQRLAIRASLNPLTEKETSDYVDIRTRAVGARAGIFRPGAAAKVFERSRGVPREINNLTLSALMAAAIAGKRHVDSADVENAHFDQENV